MLSWKLSKSVLETTLYTASKWPQSGLMSSRSIHSTDFARQAQATPRGPTSSHSTIDAADVEFFSKQVNEWWDPDGKMALLHRMNLVRVPFIRDGLVSAAEKTFYPLKGKKILDVGCGGGILSEGLARLGAAVTGIDASKDLISVAEKHKTVDPKIEQFRPTYFNCTIEQHVDTVSNLYDGVVASEVIEHVQNQELFVKSCIKACKPKGKIFFTTPNRTRLSQFALIYLAENILKVIPEGAHQFEKFITPTELTFLLERNDCHVDLSYGLSYNPLTRKFDFSDFQTLMYAIQATKLK